MHKFQLQSSICNACIHSSLSLVCCLTEWLWLEIWYKAVVVRSMPENRIVCHFDFVCRIAFASKMHFIFIHFNEHKPNSRPQSSHSVSQTHRSEPNRLLLDSGNEFSFFAHVSFRAKRRWCFNVYEMMMIMVPAPLSITDLRRLKLIIF